jgi:tetratricopeptide (TPR) repeat protein
MHKNFFLIFAVATLAQTPVAAAHDDVSRQVDDLTTALEARGASPDLLLRRADLHRIEGRHRAALADVRAALSAGAPTVRALNLKGRIELEDGKAMVAEATLTRSLQESDTFVGRWYRARARAALGRTSDALADYDVAVGLRAVTDAFLERGRLLEAQGRMGDAAQNYRLALRRVGEAGVLRERLFEAEMATGSHAAAIDAVRPMIERLPVRTRWLLMRARAHAAAGDSDAATRDRARALGDVNRALAKRRSPLLLVERARVYAALGRDASALADVDEALRRAPHYEPARELVSELGLRGTP